MSARLDPLAVAAAQAAERSWGIPASVTLAQFGLESDWGKHMPPNSNNPFGIKALPGQPVSEALTREVVHGSTVVVHAGFRKFNGLLEAFDAHARLLAEGKPYHFARQVLPDAEKFANALTGVYATDPQYGAKLINIMRADDLAQYDRITA